MSWTSRRATQESGAVAIVVALLALVLLGVGAFAVDMGAVYAKRSALQSNVDMAVLAAAAELDNGGTCNPEVVAKAIEYLGNSANEVPDQFAINLGGAPGDDDGFIRCDNWRVDLWAPRAKVVAGMARALGNDADIDVPAHAAAQIKALATSYSLPMYAVEGCASGQQTISDPPPGPSPSADPPALTPAGTSKIKNLTISPSEAPDAAVAPFPVTVSGQVRDANPTTQGQVVFVNPADGTTVDAGTPATLPGGNWTNFSLSISTVPQAVLDSPGIWWVRIRVTDAATVDYSPSAESVPFTNGELLFCDGTVSGNFGTLKIARSEGNPSTWLERNIIEGIEPTLGVNPSDSVPCAPVDSESVPTSPTDCVSTDPGFPLEAATDGLVDGSGTARGRLDQDTTEGCDRNGGSSRTQTAPALNDDMLSCFIVSGDSIQALLEGKPGILSADIFSSPRFFMIPVIPEQASNGASSAYPIVGFRPGFITEEALSATKDNPGSVLRHNGVEIGPSGVEKLNVVLFDEASLPDTAPAVGGEADYTGDGPKVIVLVE